MWDYQRATKVPVFASCGICSPSLALVGTGRNPGEAQSEPNCRRLGWRFSIASFNSAAALKKP